MTRRSLIAAGSTALLLTVVGLSFGGPLGALPVDSQPASFATAQEADDESDPDAGDDGPADSATRPRSGTGGPVTRLELPLLPKPDEETPADEPEEQEEEDDDRATAPRERRAPTGLGLIDSITGILWNGDVETGDLSQFDDTPWNQVGSPDPEVVTDPVRNGEHAIGFTIPGGAQRNELVPRLGSISSGDELWFGFSTLLDEGFPVDESWQVITQWKNDGEGSPPLSLNVENGEYLIHGGYGHPDGDRSYRQSLGSATTGDWTDWVFRVRFSSDSDDGYVEVWRDGKLVLPRYSPPGGTLYPGLDSYMKIGYYRDSGIGEDGTVFFDNWRIGESANIR